MSPLRPTSRRQMLSSFANGFGMLGVASLLAQDIAPGTANAAMALHPLGAKPPMFAPRAKHVIFLFMPGGPSQVDLWDPKPMLTRDSGKPVPFKLPALQRVKPGNLLGSPWKFKKHGQCGTEVSELFPHVAGCVDDLCVIRSMYGDNINHPGACLQMNTGEQAFSRPSIGSWMLYGLGTANANLPGFVVISPNQPGQGAMLWSSSFLPAAYQGTMVSDLQNPINNLVNTEFPRGRQREQLDLLKQLNLAHEGAREEDSRLSARIESFELAYRMQVDAPEAFEVKNESPATKELYGVDDDNTHHFGTQCLMARRLVERGVRMVQVYHTQTAMTKGALLWDQHGNLRELHAENCMSVDKPIAGLLKDLKSRGLLDETLVVWGGEFGRTPTGEGSKNVNGREHHPFGFTMWMAGGGVKGGQVYGSTDDYGWYAAENPVHVHDLHATILHLMGINHEKLTYRYSGRDYRLTDVSGRVVSGIFA